MNKIPVDAVDISSLELLRRIVLLGSLTKVAEESGTSQSALSRKLQEIEARLGFAIFERTTRRLELTSAGAVLLEETRSLPLILKRALEAVEEKCWGQQQIVRVGVSRSLSLAHLPGLFHRNREQQAKIQMMHPTGKAVVGGVLAGKLDVGVSSLSISIPQELKVAHRFGDEFILITNSEAADLPVKKNELRKWLESQRWLLPPEGSHSRQILDAWLERQGAKVHVDMELDSFDVMRQLVELKIGVAFIPRRALAISRHQGRLRKLALEKPPKRNILVFMRKEPKPSTAVQDFVDGILFS